MKKLTALSSAIGTYLLTTSYAFAQTIEINPPTRPGPDNTTSPLGYSDLGQFISNVIVLVFIIALIAVLIMLVWGAVEWIVSGGDKEAVAKARNRIINALIGMAVLAVAFALFRVATSFLGFQGNSFIIPTPPPASPSPK